MKPLSVTKKVDIDINGSKAKAFKLKCDMKLLKDAEKRREEISDFAARLYAEMMIKLQKKSESAIDNKIKFINLVEAGKVVSSFCAAISEFKFFSMVTVEDPETGETMFAFGLFMDEDQLINHFANDAMSGYCTRSYNETIKKINKKENENNCELSL